MIARSSLLRLLQLPAAAAPRRASALDVAEATPTAAQYRPRKDHHPASTARIALTCCQGKRVWPDRGSARDRPGVRIATAGTISSSGQRSHCVVRLALPDRGLREHEARVSEKSAARRNRLRAIGHRSSSKIPRPFDARGCPRGLVRDRRARPHESRITDSYGGMRARKVA
jgi:hypothetical protein